jgi:hypothetical protein
MIYSGPTSRVARDRTISLVCGIGGLLFQGVLALGLILGAIAVVFGVRSRRAGGGTLATVGLVLGVVDLVLWVASLAAFNGGAGY